MSLNHAEDFMLSLRKVIGTFPPSVSGRFIRDMQVGDLLHLYGVGDSNVRLPQTASRWLSRTINSDELSAEPTHVAMKLLCTPFSRPRPPHTHTSCHHQPFYTCPGLSSFMSPLATDVYLPPSQLIHWRCSVLTSNPKTLPRASAQRSLSSHGC